MKQQLTHWVDEKFKEKTINGTGKFKIIDKGKFEIKPKGFWISVNNSWENWLKGNWESWLKEKVCLKVTLSEDINLFIIESKEQFFK